MMWVCGDEEGGGDEGVREGEEGVWEGGEEGVWEGREGGRDVRHHVVGSRLMEGWGSRLQRGHPANTPTPQEMKLEEQEDDEKKHTSEGGTRGGRREEAYK
ncbi:hypothetical protein Pmani_039001 [Petrolisthes manimaculis]|uniref:Uncharacterized protein n=1 Tax=Petrolisthes manimaculis TaxID=1843537 RepID=A0AAE1TLT5_9EUCA|nr:hypothetical protein Pmani_039001 [Petrolisthes manimaculis]